MYLKIPVVGNNNLLRFRFLSLFLFLLFYVYARKFVSHHSYLNDSAGLAQAAFRVCEETARNAVSKVTSSAEI